MSQTPSATDNKTASKGWTLLAMQLLLVLVVSAVGTYVTTNFNKALNKYVPEIEPKASTLNKQSTGYSGLSELTERTGIASSTWGAPYRKLKNIHGTLVIIAPTYSIQPFEIAKILEWVKEGNNLILFDDSLPFRYSSLLKELGLTCHNGKNVSADTFSVDAYPESSHVDKLTLSTDAYLSSKDPNNTRILSSNEHGNAIVSIPYHNGQCIIGTDPSLCANRRLSGKQYWSNFQFLVNCFRSLDKQIYFDEKCHGWTDSQNLFVSVSRTPIGLVITQLLLVLLVALISCSQRFGQIKKLSFPRISSSLEYIDGLSSTYFRAKANSVVSGIIVNSFRTKLCKALNIFPGEPSNKLIEAWEQAYGNSKTKELKELLNSVDNTAKSRSISEEELLQLIKQCNELNEQAKTLIKVG